MYNKTIADSFVEYKDVILNLSAFRRIEIGSSLLFLLLISGGRKVWLISFSFVLALEGVFYSLNPKSMQFWVTSDLDDTHLLFIRCMGLCCVTWGLTYFFLSKSTDSTTETSYLLSCTVFMSASLLGKGHLLTHKSPDSMIGDEARITIFYTTLLFTVGTLFYTLKSNDWGGYGEQQSHANFHLRLQFVLLLLMGVICFAMPQWTVKLTGFTGKPDSAHVFFVRNTGTMFLAMAMMSNRAANFLRNNDKDAVVLCQWLFFVMVSVLGWIDSAGKWSSLEWSRIAMQGFHDAVLILNATGALDRDWTVVKRVIIPRFKAFAQDVRNIKLKRM